MRTHLHIYSTKQELKLGLHEAVTNHEGAKVHLQDNTVCCNEVLRVFITIEDLRKMKGHRVDSVAYHGISPTEDEEHLLMEILNA